MIKVIAKNVQQTIEIIEAFKDTTAELYIEIKNTTDTNSDVRKGSRTQVVSHGKLVELD